MSQQASAIVDSLVEAGTIVMLGLFLTFYLLLDGDKAWDVGLQGSAAGNATGSGTPARRRCTERAATFAEPP